MLNIRRILHPIDSSASASHAFEVACDFAERYNARLIVLGVVARPRIGEFVGFPTEIADVSKGMQQALDAIQPAGGANISIERLLIEGDSVAGEIVRVAEETHCDLIVMGTQGRTGIERLVFGSVAEEVAHNAPCPVVPIRDASRLLARSSGAYDQRESNGCITGVR
jgi:nucleotide-binding universal stress UspA family protein